jgi:hypothetical protein
LVGGVSGTVRLNNRIITDKLKVHIDDELLLEEAYKAHLNLNKHYVGKLCLKISK